MPVKTPLVSIDYYGDSAGTAGYYEPKNNDSNHWKIIIPAQARHSSN
jgi:hypothetical protein